MTDRLGISVVADDLFVRRPLAALLWQGRSEVVKPGPDGSQVCRSFKSLAS